MVINQNNLVETIEQLIEQVKPTNQPDQTNASENNDSEEDTTDDGNNTQDPNESNKDTGDDSAEETDSYDTEEDSSGDGDTGETTLNDVGKMYELQQIHYRLISIRNHLSIFVEEEFDEIKKALSKAIDLFDLVVENYAKYADKIDDIIVMYYQFIQNIYTVTNKKYKKYSNKNKQC